MLRYKLRTLLIVLVLGPPVLAGAWFAWQAWRPAKSAPIIKLYFGGNPEPYIVPAGSPDLQPDSN